MNKPFDMPMNVWDELLNCERRFFVNNSYRDVKTAIRVSNYHNLAFWEVNNPDLYTLAKKLIALGEV